MKAERKYLAHYLDAAFDATYAATNYVRIGKDLEEFAVELSPSIETKSNILGENSVTHQGYETTATADPVYYEYDDALTEKLMEIAMAVRRCLQDFLCRSTAEARCFQLRCTYRGTGGP